MKRLRDAEAQGNTAKGLIADGLGKEPAESYQLLEQAALMGDVEAMGFAAEMAGAIGNTAAREHWITTAANAGDPKAMMEAGFTSYNAGDEATAAEWFERAADAGHGDAAYVLFAMSHESDDPGGASRWLERGVELRDEKCLMAKARTYVAMNDPEVVGKAHGLFVLAARQGSTEAMTEAAVLCDTWLNEQQAEWWRARAAARNQ